MLRFLLGGCGTGKSTRLMELIKNDIADGADVLVLVPEQFSFEEEKKLYEYLGAADFNRLQTRSFATLSRHILQMYGSNARAERSATEREKLVFLYEAVQTVSKRGDLRILGRRSDMSELIGALLDLFTKLRKAGITSQKLLDTSVLLPDRLQDKTKDIAMLLLEYDRILQEHALYDRLTDLTEAAMIANIQGFFDGKSIYIDEFDSFTGDQYSMLDVILAQAVNVTAAIRTDEPDASISPIFEGGNRTYRALLKIAKDDYRISVETEFFAEYRRSPYADLHAVSTQTLRPFSPAAEYSGHVHVMEASDPVAEAEYIAATICALLSENPSLRCRDIAVAVKSLDAYGTILERAFSRYALPYHISSANSVLHTELMRYFLSLLTLLSESHWNTDSILRYMKIPFSGYGTVEVSMLEHFCFTWSIEKDDWLTPFYEEETESAERAAPFGGMRLEHTRVRFLTEIKKLKKACKGKTIRTVCEVLYQHLCRKQKAGEAYIASLDTLQQREFTVLWNMLVDIMETMVSCSGDRIAEPSALYELFRLQIAGSEFSMPPQTLDSIQIVEAQTSRLNDPAVVFVPGVSENEFPGEIHLGGMFTRQELEQLNENGIAITRMFLELYSDERLIIHKIFSAPSEHLYLTYPCINTAGERSGPSVVIRQIMSMFPGTDNLLMREAQIPLSYFIRTPEAAYFHYVRSLHRDDSDVASLRQLLLQDPFYADRVRRLSEQDASMSCRVSADCMQRFLGEQIVLSPTGIEDFYHCPFQYFCSHCLRLYAPEKNAFSHLNVGNFAHFCLEQILRKYDVKQFVSLTSKQLLEEIGALSDQFSAGNFSDALRRDSRFRLNYRMSGIGMLKVLQQMQQEMQTCDFIPVSFEMPVSNREEDAIPALSLRDGAILCAGKIDRIDCCETEEGTMLRVVDYKTGARVFEPEKLAHGLDMQMLIYLFALQRSGIYPDAVPGGVLYMPSGQPKRKNYEAREKEKDVKEILDDYYRMKGLLLDTAAQHMENGVAESCAPILSRGKTSLFSVDEKQMQQLETHVVQKICDMADALYEGKIAPDPYLHAPCSFCGCSDLCGIEKQEAVNLTAAQKKEAIDAVFGDRVNQNEEKEGNT